MLSKLLMIKDFTNETFASFSNSEIMRELVELSDKIRPWDKERASVKHQIYRAKPSEIYADFISAIFFSPGLVERIAPKSLSLFFEHLDRNMPLKQEYVNIQRLLQGKPQELFEKRSHIIREAFIEGKKLLKKYVEEKIARRKHKKAALYDIFVDLNGPIRRLHGENVNLLPDKDSPMYAIDEELFADTGWWLAVANVQRKMLDKLSEAGIDELTVAEYIFLTRVVGNPNVTEDDFSGLFEAFDTNERANIQDFISRMVAEGFQDRKALANPFGFAPGTAQKQLDFMKEKMGAENYALMEKLSKVFRDEVWAIVNDSFSAGTYPMAMQGKLSANKDFYATFAVLNYLTDKIPAGLKMQVGTMAGIANPIDATLMKMVSLVRWNAKNRAGRAIVDFVKKMDPENFIKTKRQPKRAKQGLDIITVFEDGKPVFYQVPQAIANSFNKGTVSNSNLVLVLNQVLQNNFFKHIFITWNVAFAFITNPQRDFRANLIFFKAIGVKRPLWQLIKKYIKDNKTAKMFVHGELKDLTEEMIKNKSMNKPFFDFNFHRETDPLTRTLEELELLKKGPGIAYESTNKKLLKPIVAIANWVKFVGAKNEVLSKIAGYDLLKEVEADDRKRAMLTRDFVGTPNIFREAEMSRITNEAFIFSTVAIQDAYRNYLLGTKPETRSEYWWAVLQYELLPKMLMKIAALGLAGAVLKGIYDDIPEYDKTNYIVFPLGRTDDGRVVYARFVQSEIGRFLGGILWKTMGALDDSPNIMKDFGQVFDFAGGQLPGMSPAPELLLSWADYISGRNPYDRFYGDFVIPETEQMAGGIPRLEKMVHWTLDSSGLGQYIVETDERDGWLEAAIRHTPGINSIIKISDRGFVERAREINEQIAKENAKEKLNRLEIFKDNRDRLKTEDFGPVFQDVKDEFFDSPETKKKKTRGSVMQLKGQFIAFDKYESNETPIIIMLQTGTNEGKARILLEQIAPRFSEQEMKEFTKDMLRNKIISRDVIIRMRQMTKEKTNDFK
jgi:hypothetical protein